MCSCISLRYMSFQGKSSSTAPTTTRRPRSRQISRPCRAGADGLAQRGIGQEGMVGPKAASEIEAIGLEVGADDHPALQFDELGYQLADETETDDRHSVAEADGGRAHGIQRDAAESGEAGVLEGDGVRDAGYEIAAGENRLGMAGAFAAIGYPIADGEVGHRWMLVHKNPGAGVTEHGIFAELGLELAKGADGAGNLDRKSTRLN